MGSGLGLGLGLGLGIGLGLGLGLGLVREAAAPAGAWVGAAWRARRRLCGLMSRCSSWRACTAVGGGGWREGLRGGSGAGGAG